MLIRTQNDQYYDAYRIKPLRQLRNRRGEPTRNPAYFVLVGMLYRPDWKAVTENQPGADPRELTVRGYKIVESDTTVEIEPQHHVKIHIKTGVICRAVDIDQPSVAPAIFRARMAVSCSCEDFKFCAADHTTTNTAKQRAIRYGSTYGCKHMMMVNMFDLKRDAVPPEIPNPFSNPAFQ